MRNVLIVILAGVCVWLVIERSRLMEESAVAQKEVGELQKKVTEYTTTVPGPNGTRIPAPQSATQKGGTWLDAHIDRGAKILGAPSERH